MTRRTLLLLAGLLVAWIPSSSPAGDCTDPAFAGQTCYPAESVAVDVPVTGGTTKALQDAIDDGDLAGGTGSASDGLVPTSAFAALGSGVCPDTTGQTCRVSDSEDCGALDPLEAGDLPAYCVYDTPSAGSPQWVKWPSGAASVPVAWALLEGGGDPGAIPIAVAQGDHPSPYFVRLTVPSGTTNYSAAISSVDPCKYPADPGVATHIGWITSPSSGSITFGTDELFAITTPTAYQCATGTYTATITISDNAATLPDQVFAVTMTVGAEPTGYASPDWYFDGQGGEVSGKCRDSFGLDAEITESGGTVFCDHFWGATPNSTRSILLSGVSGAARLDTDVGETGAHPNRSTGLISYEFGWRFPLYATSFGSAALLFGGSDVSGESGFNFRILPTTDRFYLYTDGDAANGNATPATAMATNQVHFTSIEYDIDNDDATLDDDLRGTAPGTGDNVSISANGTSTATLDGWRLGRDVGAMASAFNVDDIRVTFDAAPTNYALEVFGDSISESADDWEVNWGDLLPWRFAQLNSNSLGGRDCDAVSTELDAVVTAGLATNRIGVIQCGTNDVNDAGYVEATTLGQVQEMVDDLQANGNTLIVIVGPPYIYAPASFTNCGGTKAACDALVDSLTTAMAAIATAEGASVAFASIRDSFSAMTNPELCFSGDGVHPDTGACQDRAGSEIIAAIESIRP